jgi:hypothetical protein
MVPRLEPSRGEFGRSSVPCEPEEVAVRDALKNRFAAIELLIGSGGRPGRGEPESRA